MLSPSCLLLRCALQVVFLKGGERLELAGLEKWKEIKAFIERESSWISDV
jgi:hypothetical protein